MIRILQIILLLILTDFYLFPFEFSFLPGYNVKMIMAGISLPFICFSLAKKREALVSKNSVSILLFLVPISLMSFFTNIWNDTSDFSFNFYFISVFVWMSAAFAVVSLMKLIHGVVSIQILSNYIIGVCCFQCILAATMIYNPALNEFVNGLMADGEGFMGDAGDRMHGIGCALDVAGGRFAAVLVMISFLLARCKNKIQTYYYIISFVIIFVIGNMIGRTASVGGVLSIIYWIYYAITNKCSDNYPLKCLCAILCIIFPLIVILYNTNSIFHNYLRFGFEGFFSLAEKGKWEVQSNEILFKHMITFPDNLKTWIIGDGYGANPSEYDPYYTGKKYHGFYKGTDIGYLRFIYFFGVVGMSCIVALFIRFWSICCKHFPNLKELVTLILLINLIIWFKATTDLLPIFALLIVISQEDQEEYERQIYLEAQTP